MIIKNPNMSDIPGNIRDPMITRYGDRYYLVASSPQFWSGYTPGVRLWSSDDLVNWRFESTIISADNIKEGCHCKNRFWAPELFIHNGKFYCTVNARDDECGIDLHVYLAEADEITGPYRLHEEPVIDRNFNDANLFADDDGTVYMTASWNDLYIMKIDLEKGKVISEPRVIASPGKPGEWDHGRFIEGSFLIKRGGKYYLWYSTPRRGYEMGMYVADSIDGEFRRYCDGPILTGLGTDIPIAGHNGCFTLVDGRDAISFHGHAKGQPERLCIDIVTYPMEPRKISMEVEI